MKKFFKFGKGRKESGEGSSKAGGLGRQASVTSLVQTFGGYEVREKDLSKLHKAAWTGDMTKLTQLIKSSRGVVVDKENRQVAYFSRSSFFSVVVSFLLYNILFIGV